MEDYLHFMKTLRSQMNDVEDQAAKLSVEEQKQLTIIQTFKNDLISEKLERNELKEDIERMLKEKGDICSQILEKQRKIASLESDSSQLAQALELIHQERNGLCVRLTETRTNYLKTIENINIKLQEQKDLFDSLATSGEAMKHRAENDERQSLMMKLEASEAKLHEISDKKSKLVMENNKIKQAIDQVNNRAKDFEPVLMTMDVKVLEEEYSGLCSDKAGLTEYLQTLQEHVEKLKGISHVIKCTCGKEYEVGTDIFA